MKKTIGLVFAVVLLGSFAVTGTSFAQSAPADTQTLQNAVAVLGQVEVARQGIVSQVGLQLGNVALQVKDLFTTPLTTDNEKQATAFQLGALAGQISNLAGILAATITIQTAETSLLSSIQTNLSANQ